MDGITTVGLDLAKRVFQVRGADAKARRDRDHRRSITARRRAIVVTSRLASRRSFMLPMAFSACSRMFQRLEAVRVEAGLPPNRRAAFPQPKISGFRRDATGICLDGRDQTPTSAQPFKELFQYLVCIDDARHQKSLFRKRRRSNCHDSMAIRTHTCFDWHLLFYKSSKSLWRKHHSV